MKHEGRAAARGEEEQGPLLSHLAFHTFLHVFSRELFCFLLVWNLGLVIHIAQIMEKILVDYFILLVNKINFLPQLILML